MTYRPTWDEWALAIAQVVATRADCTRAQVGCVILSRTNRTIGTGYNGLAAGIPGCASSGNCPRGRMTTEQVARDSDYSNCGALHAEQNAILHADPHALPGATLYTTRKPCPACTTWIKSAGITRVVWPEGEYTP